MIYTTKKKKVPTPSQMTFSMFIIDRRRDEMVLLFILCSVGCDFRSFLTNLLQNKSYMNKQVYCRFHFKTYSYTSACCSLVSP